MKRTIAIFFLIFTTLTGFSQALPELILQAKNKYAEGQYQPAVVMVDMAASTHAVNLGNKKIIADAYNEIGDQEYARRNLLNAYDCFRKAVKIYPTHKQASESFWKIKQNYDVTALKNEGTSSSADATSSAGTNGTTTTADIAPVTSTEDVKKYQQELARQAELIRQLQASYSSASTRTASSDPETTAFNRAILENLTKLYQNAVSMKDTSDLDIITTQMREYRQMFERQQSSQSTIIWAIVFTFGGVILVVAAALIILFLVARRHRKREFAYATDYGIGVGGHGVPALEEAKPLLLAQETMLPETESKDAKGQKEPSDFYRDIIRAERLKEMANEKKYGALKWETLRDYIGELEKDLRSEILYVVESKLNSPDEDDFASLLPVLFPFLADSDDYLRDKAHHLLERSLTVPDKAAVKRQYLEYDETDNKKSKDPLSVAALLRHVDKLKNIKPARREHSINVAKYVRGMGLVLRLPKDAQELLYKTALVHDIGYTLLDQETLEEIADKKDLTEKEGEFIRTHPEKGVAYFKGVDIPEEMRQGILYHHERNDGSGYPKGLSGEKIPAFAKIIGIADVFDALTTNRVFREKMSFDSAIVILKDLGRSKIESEYLQALIEYLKSSGKIKR